MGRSAQEARKSHQNPRSWSPGQLQPSPPECWELKSGPLKRTGNAFGSLSQGASPEKVVIDNFVSVCVCVCEVCKCTACAYLHGCRCVPVRSVSACMCMLAQVRVCACEICMCVHICVCACV